MREKITNVNIIATYIHNNPGCRRTDIKRHLYLARTGQKPLRGYHDRVCNQYFQTYGSASNVYLDRLWYNQLGRPTKSSYVLTAAGKSYVLPKSELVRPFKAGELIEWQFDSPRRHGWCVAGFADGRQRGLVIDCNETYGLWALSLDGNHRYISHHAYIRAAGV